MMSQCFSRGSNIEQLALAFRQLNCKNLERSGYIYMTDNASVSIFYMCFVAQVFLSRPDKITFGTVKKYGFWTQFGTFCGTHLWFGHNLIASQMKHYIIWSDYDNYIDIIHCEEMNAIPQSIGFIALKLEFNRNRHERAEPCIFYSW